MIPVYCGFRNCQNVDLGGIIHYGIVLLIFILAGQGDAIRRLAAEKSAAFGRAYAFLAAAGEVEQAADSRMDPCIRENSPEALADRILRRFPAPAAEGDGGGANLPLPSVSY